MHLKLGLSCNATIACLGYPCEERTGGSGGGSRIGSNSRLVVGAGLVELRCVCNPKTELWFIAVSEAGSKLVESRTCYR